MGVRNILYRGFWVFCGLHLVVIVSHILHHQQVRKRAEQEHCTPKNVVSRNIEKISQRQANDGQQAAGQHDQQVFLFHIYGLAPFERWVLDIKVSIFDFGGKFI